MRTWLSDGNASGDRRSQTPATIGRALGWNNRGNAGDVRTWRGLINFERDHGCAKQHRRRCHGVRREARNVEAHHEILRPADRDFPERLTEQFIALPAMKFVQEILEIARAAAARIFSTAIAGQFRCRRTRPSSFVFTSPGSCEIRPDNFATAGSRRRAGNVPFLQKRSRFYLSRHGAFPEYGT